MLLAANICSQWCQGLGRQNTFSNRFLRNNFLKVEALYITASLKLCIYVGSSHLVKRNSYLLCLVEGRQSINVGKNNLQKCK